LQVPLSPFLPFFEKAMYASALMRLSEVPPKEDVVSYGVLCSKESFDEVLFKGGISFTVF
jgi:hypothetical protein